MSNWVLGLLATAIGPISGLITHQLMEYVDDVKGWTDRLPDGVKRAIVLVLASVIPFVNAQWGVNLPADTAGLLSQPSIQSLVAFLLALVFKGPKKGK